MKISLELNNQKVKTNVSSSQRLIDWLRNDMGLTGTKEGCGEGECGACTVLLDGKPINSCLILMGQVNGKKIVTIEGIREEAIGKKLIDSFIHHGAVQCGFCTPGMIMAAVPLIQENRPLMSNEIKQGMAGNLCRCTGYVKIIEAIQKVTEGNHE